MGQGLCRFACVRQGLGDEQGRYRDPGDAGAALAGASNGAGFPAAKSASLSYFLPDPSAYLAGS